MRARLVIVALICLLALLLGQLGESDTLAAVTLSRELPNSVSPGSSFRVTVTFSAPANDFNAIGITDFAPEGWAVVVDNVDEDPAWCSPNPIASNATDNRADYIWFGPYSAGTSFTVAYLVTVPVAAKADVYDFSDGQLEYYIASDGPFVDNIAGDSQVTIPVEEGAPPGGAQDETPPAIIAYAPLNGAQDVSADIAVKLTFSEAMNESSAEDAFKITPRVNGDFHWEGTTLIFTPSPQFASSTTYKVTIGKDARDKAGNRLAEAQSFGFTTSATTSGTPGTEPEAPPDKEAAQKPAAPGASPAGLDRESILTLAAVGVLVVVGVLALLKGRRAKAG